MSADRCYEPHLSFRKKHRLEPGRRIFICKGERCCAVRTALLGRGWFENTHALFNQEYDLKWTVKRATAEDDFGNVSPSQLLNHFPKRGGVELGSKTALLRNLQDHFSGHSSALAAMMPRSYSLQSPEELAAFLRDFAATRAEAVLRTLLEAGGVIDESAQPVAAVACDVLQRYIEAPDAVRVAAVRCHSHWTRLLGRAPEPPRCLLVHGRPCAGCESQSTDMDESMKISAACDDPELLLARLPPQHQVAINDKTCLWVLKVPHLSRGRGIHVFTDITHILDQAFEHRWNVVVQKYVERPLLLDGVKCDLRVWALVTSWAPRCVLFAHTEPYLCCSLRPFSSEETSLQDEHIHLSNVGHDRRLSLLFQTMPGAEERWHAFTWPKICEALSASVLSVADAAHMHSVSRGRAARQQQGPSSFEIFGFDFALSADLTPWLLEANTSPAMGERSSPDMQSWLQDAVEGLLDIVLGLHEQTLTPPQVGDRIGPWQVLTNCMIDANDARQRFYEKGAWRTRSNGNHLEVVRQALFPKAVIEKSTRRVKRSRSAPPTSSTG